MFSVVPNIVFVPNMMQNAEHKHRMQDTNTANFQSSFYWDRTAYTVKTSSISVECKPPACREHGLHKI